jgi:hypothetical protein
MQRNLQEGKIAHSKRGNYDHERFQSRFSIAETTVVLKLRIISSMKFLLVVSNELERRVLSSIRTLNP